MENVAILSEISIFPIKPTSEGLLGFTSFVLNDHFYAGNIAIVSRPNGSLRLVYPEKILPNAKRINIFHPITKKAGDLILFEVTKKYQEITSRAINESLP